LYILGYIYVRADIYLYIGTKNIESIKTRFIISIFFFFQKGYKDHPKYLLYLSHCILSISRSILLF